MPEAAVQSSVARAMPASQSDMARRRLALGLMVASGCAALGYQIVWTQQSALWLGHEAAAVLAVVAAFFGGLAAGALVLGPRIDRSTKPARWYAACEAVIGSWSLLLAFFMAPAAWRMLELAGPEPAPAWQWTVAFCGTFFLLLPATAAMGATLPAMERLLVEMRRQGATIAALYAANTFGAVLGVLAAAFWLVPELGLTRTAAVCSTLNFLCAAATLTLLTEPANVLPATARPHASGLLLLLAATGLLGIGYEVLVVRALSQVAENTVYTFAMLLAVYLIGTALGAAAYARLQAGWSRHPELLRELLLLTLAAACLLGMMTLAGRRNRQGCRRGNTGARHARGAGARKPRLRQRRFSCPTILMGAALQSLEHRCPCRRSQFRTDPRCKHAGRCSRSAHFRGAARASNRARARAAAGSGGLPGAVHPAATSRHERSG